VLQQNNDNDNHNDHNNNNNNNHNHNHHDKKEKKNKEKQGLYDSPDVIHLCDGMAACGSFQEFSSLNLTFLL